jgi:4-diphosphocytidyl-2-C-methyl-D-erythritol kinase
MSIQSQAPFQWLSYAKINLGLRVVSKLPNGYHTISSNFVEVSLADVLSIEPIEHAAPGTIEVTCSPQVTETMESNLVYKAATRFQTIFDCSRVGTKIRVQKYIPAAGGLGGGSSNAASTLAALARFHDINVSAPDQQQKILRIAQELGSDVPFFLQGGIAHVHGTGADVTPVAAAFEAWIVIVPTAIRVSTSDAYQALSARRFTNPTAIYQPLPPITGISFTHPELFPTVFDNHFEEVVFEMFPQLATIKQHLYDCGVLYAQMSGSGSTMYGVCATEADALSVQHQLQYPSYICQPTAPRQFGELPK